jgi:hypothetical protein
MVGESRVSLLGRGDHDAILPFAERRSLTYGILGDGRGSHCRMQEAHGAPVTRGSPQRKVLADNHADANT